MNARIGIDIGGTFTDVVLYDEDTNELHTTKVPSTPPNFEEGVLSGCEKILEVSGTDVDEVISLSHGTTVGTNAVLEEDIPRVGLITNEGLRDVLNIGKQRRPEGVLYDLQADKPPELIPRYLRKEVPGRMDWQGTEVDPLDEERVRAAVSELADEGVESIAVAMLFAYLNDEHEQRIGDIIESYDADIDHALSSVVHPEIREYDRTITTVLNLAVRTVIRDYLGRLAAGFVEMGLDVPMRVMHSGGGTYSVDQASHKAVRMLLSGPAGGAVATLDLSQKEGFENAIGMDMGGTSTDVSIVRNGEVVHTTEGTINDLPMMAPMIDITTVGAGGGSIAKVDAGGGLGVGPQSAGADPGPICYGWGGSDPTVTDANLLLGRLSFRESAVDPVVDRTRERFGETIADPLDESIEEAALSVVKVANARLVRNVRKVTVERGDYPRDFALVSFGGAGPLQAPAVASMLEMDTVIVPPTPGVFSGRGVLAADMRIDEVFSYRAGEIDHDVINGQFEEMEDTLISRSREQGFSREDVLLNREADMRYKGQAFEITVPVESGRVDADAIDTSRELFHDEHRRLYGHSKEDEPLELVTLRANARVPSPALQEVWTPTDDDPYRGERNVYFEGTGFRDTDIVDRPALAPGATLEGPAIIEEPGSTSILPPKKTARVTENGSIVISL